MNENDLNKQVVTDQQDENQKGASLVEYALLVALIAVVCIVAVRTLGNNISAKFSGVGSSLTAAN